MLIHQYMRYADWLQYRIDAIIILFCGFFSMFDNSHTSALYSSRQLCNTELLAYFSLYPAFRFAQRLALLHCC